MNETKQDILINELRQSVNELMELYRQVKTDKQTLERQCAALQLQLSVKETQLQNVESRYNALKLSKGFVDAGQTTPETKRKINQIIQEIDRCIDMLDKSEKEDE